MSANFPKVGITLSIRSTSPGDFLTLAKEADEAGLYALTVGDAGSDTFSLLSAAAGTTSRIRLISSIATWTRTPLTTARAVRAVDLLSDGRYTLGLGSMPPHFNEDHHGIPYDSPLKRMSEYVQAVRVLLEADARNPVDFDGEFYRISNFRATDSPPDHHIPILIGATRARMTRMAAEITDGVIFNSVHSVPWLRDIGVPSLMDGANRSGRTLEMLDKGVIAYAAVTDDQEKFRTMARRTLAFYLTLPYGQEWLGSQGFEEEATLIAKALANGDRKAIAASISDRVVDAMTIIGSPDACREQVAQYASLVDWIQLSPPMGLSSEETFDAIRHIIATFKDTS